MCYTQRKKILTSLGSVLLRNDTIVNVDIFSAFKKCRWVLLIPVASEGKYYKHDMARAVSSPASLC